MSKTRYLRFGVAALVIGLTAFLAVPGPVGAQVTSIGGLTVGGTSIATGTGIPFCLPAVGDIIAGKIDAALGSASSTMGISAAPSNLTATFDSDGNLNIAATLGSKDFALSQQAFRCLTPEHRLLFRRFTPPILYLPAKIEV